LARDHEEPASASSFAVSGNINEGGRKRCLLICIDARCFGHVRGRFVLVARKREYLRSGYVGIGKTTGTFDGFPALFWEFDDAVNGEEPHNIDVFISEPNGHGWRVLIRAPESVWSQNESLLEGFENSLVIA
jgi:hypothetical protein